MWPQCSSHTIKTSQSTSAIQHRVQAAIMQAIRVVRQQLIILRLYILDFFLWLWEMAEKVSELKPAHFSHTSAPSNTVPTSHELWIPRPILPFMGCISPPLFCLSIGNLYWPIPILAFMGLVHKSWLLVVLQPVRLYDGSQSQQGSTRHVETGLHNYMSFRYDTSIEEKFPRHEFISHCHPCDEWPSFPRARQPLRSWYKPISDQHGKPDLLQKSWLVEYFDLHLLTERKSIEAVWSNVNVSKSVWVKPKISEKLKESSTWICKKKS